MSLNTPLPVGLCPGDQILMIGSAGPITWRVTGKVPGWRAPNVKGQWLPGEVAGEWRWLRKDGIKLSN